MERPTSPTNKSESGTTEQLKDEAAGLAEDAKQQVRHQADTHKQTVADQTESVAGAVGRAAEQFRQEDQQSLAEYAGQLAGEMKSFADNLRGRSVDELLQDTQQFARRNPAAFLLASVAVGFALSRFVKASASDPADRHYGPKDIHAVGTPVQPASPVQTTGLGETA